MHRGDIKPSHTRKVSVKHCKPFKGEIRAEEIVDPIMLSQFLDDLGVNNDAEIISEIDTESLFSEDTRISSESGTHVSGGPPPDDEDGSPPRQPPRYNPPIRLNRINRTRRISLIHRAMNRAIKILMDMTRKLKDLLKISIFRKKTKTY
jgi:hypothetical protein